MHTSGLADLHELWRLEEGAGRLKRSPTREVDEIVIRGLVSQELIADLACCTADVGCVIEYLLPGVVAVDLMNDQHVRIHDQYLSLTIAEPRTEGPCLL